MDIFNSSESRPIEVSERVDKDTKSVAGLSAAKLVDNQLAAESTKLVQIGKHKQMRLAERYVWVRLRGLAVACWTTDHYHRCSNLGVGISEGGFVFDFVSLPLEVARPI